MQAHIGPDDAAAVHEALGLVDAIRDLLDDAPALGLALGVDLLNRGQERVAPEAREELVEAPVRQLAAGDLRTHVAERAIGKANVIANDLDEQFVRLAFLVHLELIELQAFQPGIGHARSRAKSGAEFVEVNLQGGLLSLAAQFAKQEEPELAKLIAGLQRVRVNVVGLDDGNRDSVTQRATAVAKLGDTTAKMHLALSKLRDEIDRARAAVATVDLDAPFAGVPFLLKDAVLLAASLVLLRKRPVFSTLLTR